jgi:hypothetical protein
VFFIQGRRAIVFKTQLGHLLLLSGNSRTSEAKVHVSYSAMMPKVGVGASAVTSILAKTLYYCEVPRGTMEIGEKDVQIHCSKSSLSSLLILDLIGSQDSIANSAGNCPFDKERPARCTGLSGGLLQSASGLSAGRPIRVVLLKGSQTRASGGKGIDPAPRAECHVPVSHCHARRASSDDFRAVAEPAPVAAAACPASGAVRAVAELTRRGRVGASWCRHGRRAGAGVGHGH